MFSNNATYFMALCCSIAAVPLIHWDPDHPEYFDDNHRRKAEFGEDEQSAEKVYNLDKDLESKPDSDLEQSKPVPSAGRRTWSDLFDCSTSKIIPVSVIAENEAPHKLEDVDTMQPTDI
jgi:hypothetical protein